MNKNKIGFFTPFKSRCYNGGRQHKFKPRFTTAPAFTSANIIAKGYDEAEIKEMLSYKVYTGEVCAWCGAVISQQRQASSGSYGNTTLDNAALPDSGLYCIRCKVCGKAMDRLTGDTCSDCSSKN